MSFYVNVYVCMSLDCLPDLKWSLCSVMPLYTVAFPNEKTKVQTLGAVALHATTACTHDASFVGLSHSIGL